MLFGHQNDDTVQPAQPTPTIQATSTNPLAIDPTTGISLPTAPTPPPPPVSAAEPEEPSILNQPTTYTDTAPAVASAPSFDTTPPAPQPEPTEPAMPVAAEPAPVAPPTPADTTEDEPSPFASDASDDAAASAPAVDDLLNLKQQALEQLGPLVDQLEQTPEEKFRTTMMLIQSTDNPSRIPDAYEAAQQITDEKIRAQALLDVINEINYFTHAKPAE